MSAQLRDHSHALELRAWFICALLGSSAKASYLRGVYWIQIDSWPWWVGLCSFFF